jgi:secondary thiamine-phosphate synthase enzyme
MKSYRKELWFILPERQGVINITQDIKDCLESSGIDEGLCLVNAMNVTSSIFINDYEEMLLEEFEKWLEKLAPHDPEQSDLTDTDEVFKDVHLKRTLMGRDVTVAVTKGELDLGTFEQILYYEFDGKRRKHVLVKIIGE